MTPIIALMMNHAIRINIKPNTMAIPAYNNFLPRVISCPPPYTNALKTQKFSYSFQQWQLPISTKQESPTLQRGFSCFPLAKITFSYFAVQLVADASFLPCGIGMKTSSLL